MVVGTAVPTRPEGAAARRNHVVVRGAASGLPVVFGHGFGCDQSMWRFVTPSFEQDCQVITFDHVGCGGSDLAAYDAGRYATLHGYAEDLVEVLDELGLRQVVFVGHSVSGMIGVLAVLARPDLFRALVLVGASPRYVDDEGYVGGFTKADVEDLLAAMESNFLAWSQATAPVVMGNAGRPELTEELAASFARTEGTIAQQFAGAIFLSDYRAEVARLRLPALVLQSEQDPMAPEQVGTYLHQAIPGSTLVSLRASGHFPHVSGPDETAAAIRSFLERLP